MSLTSTSDEAISASQYEDILSRVGGFGRFQIRIFVLVSLFETPAAWAMLLPILTSASSDWICPGSNSSQLNSTVENLTVSCREICPGIQYTADFTSIRTQWDLICERKYIPDLITSLQMMGVLIGALLVGQLADMFGRRKLLFSSYVVLLVVWFISGFSSTWQMYAVMRVFVGASIGGCLVVNFVLPLEFVTPRWRTFCGCIGFWAIGVMTLSLWGYFIRDWRHVTIASSVAGVPLLLSWWWIPESPRWLLSKGRIEEATAILHIMAIVNKKPLPQLSELDRLTQMNSVTEHSLKKFSYWHLCSSCHLAKNTLIAMYGWFVSSSVYYGFSLNVKTLAGDRYLNMFLSGLVEIPAIILVVIINNRFGRRKTSCVLMLIAGLACAVIVVFSYLDKLTLWSEAVTALAMLGKFGIVGAWLAFQVFSAEIFPTVIRNIGIGSCSMAARVGGIVAPQFVFLGSFSSAIPYMIFGTTAIICAVLSLALPETNKVPLKDQLEVAHNGQVTSDLTNRIQDNAIPLQEKS